METTELNDYQTVKDVIKTLKPRKQTTVDFKDLKMFRRYLAKHGKELSRTYATKLIKGKLLIIRTT